MLCLRFQPREKGTRSLKINIVKFLSSKSSQLSSDNTQ